MSRFAFATWVQLLFVTGTLTSTAAPPATVDFARDIRPLLSDTCYHCHGPDQENQQADLRLDLKQSLYREHDGQALVVPGDPENSLLYLRITAEDPAEAMPPEDAQVKLTASQKQLIETWIKEGAVWKDHWAFEPPVKAPLPSVAKDPWVTNEIDAFVLARLKEKGITPSQIASKEKLIRRVTLDLTGLPPTQEEVRAFLEDESHRAYERVVDRLLKSERYGERMAMQWLDVARYADTNGYQTDGERHMWRWREWVIESFNTNKSFQDFTIEQLAGDLLPNASTDQILATGFNRNHRSNSEGGIVFEEYLVEYAVDRVDTTATVWLGLTMGCARCHDHKYDPISQKEFYEVMAFFNNIPERGRVIKYGNSFPVIKAPTRQMAMQLNEYETEMHQLRERLDNNAEDIQSRIHDISAKPEPDKPVIHQDLMIQFSWDQTHEQQTFEVEGKAEDYDVINTGEIAKELYEASVTGSEEAMYASGISGKALKLDQSYAIDGGAIIQFAGHQKLTLSTWIKVDEPSNGTIISMLNPDDRRPQGFSWRLVDNRIQVNFGPRWLDDSVRLRTKASIPSGQWVHIAFTSDGTQMARGMAVYVNGERQQLDVLLDIFTGTYKTNPTLMIGAEGKNHFLKGLLDETRFYLRDLSAQEIRSLAVAESPAQIAELDEPSAAQNEKLLHYYLDQVDESNDGRDYRTLRSLEAGTRRFVQTIPTSMVMQENAERDTTHVLIRGQYDNRGEEVTMNVPRSLLPADDSRAFKSRLDLARWIVSEQNPLTARVIVNRFWYQFFGRGIVKTLEDFGSQGAPPTHPRLLDWLAVDFRESGWDVKALVKSIVTSSTYRQDSLVNQTHLQQDPENIWLARASRLRLPAETLRDQALAVSGLLNGTIGGPSVKPYQPEGLWKEIASQAYDQGTGEDLYRRGMYTFWKRTVPPPTMVTFDASSREICVLSRSRTNTPLQALALLNEVSYVEAARNLAQQMMLQHDEVQQRLRWGWRQVTGREPTPFELEVINRALQRNMKRYQADLQAARGLIGFGESVPDETLKVDELAAYTAVASMLMNLDEVINRE
tara:strand:+ start:948 stop:4142 length:3195 start_codon:yes stop_codon:yes gene_type:complete